MSWLCKIIGHKIRIVRKMHTFMRDGREMTYPAAGNYPEGVCVRKNCNYRWIE